ncbi:MAG TPA: hypothetical protein VK906_13550, partial [Egicoccus sp.]
ATDADDPRVTRWVAHLERALGLADFGPVDPSGGVTARRFARVHAAAQARGYVPETAVSAAVDAALAGLGEVAAEAPAAASPTIAVRSAAA